MHPNPIFRKATTATNLAFAAETGAGLFTVSQPDGPPLAAQSPFSLTGDDILLHLVRSNPMISALPAPCRLVVMGPQGYVSPDWYGVEDQVPTWNYVSVHITGQLEPVAQDELRGILDKLTEDFETRLLPKPIWRLDKLGAPQLEKMMRAIQPFRMRIEQIEGTWKLNQNKTETQRLRAADQIEAQGLGIETAALARYMRYPPR